MRIAIIVSSNIVKDPRVVKQAEVVKSITDDYMVFGKYDENATIERQNKLKFKYKLIKITSGNSIVSKAFSRLRFGFKLIKELKKYNPDIIHANDFDMLFFAYFIKGKRQKLIYDAHEIYAKNGSIVKYPLLSWIIFKLEKSFLKKVDHFITVSHAAKQYYKDKNYSKEAVVITNVPIKTQHKIYQKSEKFQVLYQGIVSENRGYEEFANAADYLKEYDKIQLVIRGYGAALDNIKKIKYDKNLFNLIIDKPVEMNEMISAATKSNIGIVMTKPVSENYEYTVSNKIFEYIHAGLPVILSPVKEHVLLNEKFNIGLIVSEINGKEIANAIEKLYLDHVLYNKIKKNVCASIDELNWQKESQLLIELYKN